MKMKPKTETVDGKTFEIPVLEVFCEKCEECGTANYFYDDDSPPFRCDNCGAEFKNVRSEPPFDAGSGERA